MPLMNASLLSLFALALVPRPHGQDAEPTLQFSMLRNGNFEIPQERAVVAGGIPWWIQEVGTSRLQELEGDTWLVTSGEAIAQQPVPAYAPTTTGILVRGRVQGEGVVRLLDGLGRSAALDVGQTGTASTFEWSGEEITKAMGAAPMPRLELELSAQDGGSAAWTDLEVLVPLPCPDEEALRAEILERLHLCLDPWLERAIDNLGPRATGLVGTFFDAITGEILANHPAGSHPLIDILHDAIQAEPDPRWVAAVEAYTRDSLELLMHPETGIPRKWNVVEDRPLNDRFHQIYLDLSFLIDVAEEGPEGYREAALAAAEKLAESVLASGVLPDGNVASLYRPSDGASSNETRPIRRFDMPAQLTRLAQLNGDQRLVEAARDAVATMLYTHYWPGSWNRIDPGFDDDYGHYGARAATMARCFPEEALFRRVVDGGWDRFRVIWPQALRYGGSMAADQVRCWKLLIEYSELRPDIREELAACLDDAVHSHLRGQQYNNGAWGDVTYFGYQPAVDLQVGDLPGTPTNLLEGLAIVYDSGLGPSNEELRALFTAVLRSSVNTYWREYGFLSTVREVEGSNHAGGSIRIGAALTTMLKKLSESR